MENAFLQSIEQKVSEWRCGGYQGVEKETKNILTYLKRVGFLHQPQIEALETYIYLKEILKNKSSKEIFLSFFSDRKEMLLGLGFSKSEAFDLIDNQEEINRLLREKFGSLNYPNQVYALTMGSGKTILIAVMIYYDFILSFFHSDDNRFAKNALVFAPDTTIIESLKEIKTFDFSKVIPKEYRNIILNIKYHYLESINTTLSPIGNYNIIVTNSHKIILKTKNKESLGNRLLLDYKDQEKKEIENLRLYSIRQLSNLAIFVDEAHHSYGKTLEGTLKKSKQTIDYIHGNSKLTGVINLTGTPYVNNRMIDDVVYHFGLKHGIEKGILKQVRFSEFTNVKTDEFIENVIGTFIVEYSDKTLEGLIPKIAFYCASIEDLQQNLKPRLEKVLISRNIDISKVLEYHTEAEENKTEFFKLDTPESDKQFILLVGKGTEGWNCRSLVSCALFRKPKSSIFVLQSSTRCLRSIGDNSTLAHIFLSEDNYKILDQELKNNFSTNIEELSSQDQKNIEYTLRVIKTKKVKVKKIYKEVVAIKKNDLSHIKLNLERYDNQPQSFISSGGIYLNKSGQAEYKEIQVRDHLKQKNKFLYYEVIEKINRITHLACVEIHTCFKNNGLTREEIPNRLINNNYFEFLVESIVKSAFEYKEHIETSEEELELTKSYPFKINISEDKKSLVVFKEDWANSGKLGFHINPYNFDSSDEKNLFKYLRQVLENDESVQDIYFTGGTTDSIHNEFYFEYYSPDRQQVSRYFPDFLIETTKGRYLVVEVKSSKEKQSYEKNKQLYKGSIKDIFDEVFAKEIGFREFQKINSNFEYKIIFDANLQKFQHEIAKEIKSFEQK